MEMSLVNRVFPFLLSVAAMAIQSVEGDAYAFNNTGPLSTYKSVSRISFLSAQITHIYVKQRPDIFAPFLNMTLYNKALVTPGYIFLEPFQTTQPGPYLYDNAGVCSWLLATHTLADQK
jgi:hypothetical protein